MHNMIAILKDHHPEELGMIPDMIDQNDPRSAREQFDANYRHGGGWHPIPGFAQLPHFGGKKAKGIILKYPGDPPLEPIATWPLRDELIVVYCHGFVAIFQTKDGSFEVARMD